MSSGDIAMETSQNRNEANNKRLSCPLYGCKRAYTDESSLQSHIKDHELPTQSLPGKTMTCATVGCGGSFPNMQKLMEHMRHHHKPNIYFLCESCHAKLRSYRGLLVHLRTCAKAARPKQNAVPSPSGAAPPVPMDVDTVQPPQDTLSSPALPQMDPASTQLAPASTQLGPTPPQQGPALLQLGPAPPQMGPTPPQMGPVPPQMGLSPQQMGPSPPHMGPSPPQMGPAPPQMGPAPPQMGPAPPQMGPAPPQMGPAPPQMGPAPPQMGPAPPQMGPAPPQMGPAPPQMGPASPQMGPVPSLTNQPHVISPNQDLTSPNLMQHIIDSTVNALFSKNNPQFSPTPKPEVQAGLSTNEGQVQHQKTNTAEISGPTIPQTLPTNVWKSGLGPNPERRILWQHTRGRYTCVQCGHTVTNRNEMTEHSAVHNNSLPPKDESSNNT